MCVPRRLILRDVGHMDLHMLPRVDPRSVSGRDLKLQQIESIVHLGSAKSEGSITTPFIAKPDL